MDDFDLNAFENTFDESALEDSAKAAQSNLDEKEKAAEAELKELRKDAGKCVGGSCAI